MSHTPRPWVHEQTGPSPNGLDQLISSDGQAIAWAYKPDDAILIAAAPELLDALRIMIEHAEWSTPQGRSAFDAARDAIAKATGGGQ